MKLLETLILEVSLEMLKQQFVDTKKITPKDFEAIKKAVDKKSAYATWLTSKVAKKFIKPEDIYKWENYFDIFDRRKKDYPKQDINQYKTQEDLDEFVEKTIELRDQEEVDPSQQKGVTKDDKFAKLRIGEVQGFTVYKIPKGSKDLYGTSCELGSGTEWCTAHSGYDGHFKDYIGRGPLYIFTKGKEKYQFHYEDSQFMDKNDNDVIDTEKRKKPPHYIYLFFKFLEKEEKKEIPIDAIYIFDRKALGENVIKNPHINSPKDLKKIKPGTTILGDLYISFHNAKNLDNQITLPSGLKISGTLYMRYARIKELPEDLQVSEEISLHSIPEKYPEHLANKIEIQGVKLETLLLLQKVGKRETITKGKKKITGMAVTKPTVEEIPESIVNLAYDHYDDVTPERVKQFKEVFLPEVNWQSATFLRTSGSNNYPENYLFLNGVLEGESILVEIQRRQWAITGPAGTKSLSSIADKNFKTAPGKKNALIDAIMGRTKPKEKSNQDPKIVKLIKNLKAPKVSMEINPRITRTGPGVKGSFDTLKTYLSSPSQDNLEALTQTMEIEWKEILIYNVAQNYNFGTVALFVVKGVDKKGREFFYDRSGVGPAGQSTLRAGNKSAKVTAGVAGELKPDDFFQPKKK